MAKYEDFSKMLTASVHSIFHILDSTPDLLSSDISTGMMRSIQVWFSDVLFRAHLTSIILRSIMLCEFLLKARTRLMSMVQQRFL